MDRDTIFARATGSGRAGVMIVRLSGPAAFTVAEALVGPLPPVHTARLRRIRNPDSGALIDEGLVIAFPEGASFTGETSIEFQIHGSAAVERLLARTLLEQDGVRYAEAGEFTRRALENGRLDLTQIEGLSDLLAAETEAQHRQAVSLQQGAFRDRIEGWRSGLTRAMALAASMIDFADEDIPESVVDELLVLVSELEQELLREVATVSSAERLRKGFEVAIIGRPNVGKSTLINVIADRDIALVSDQPGTTRDVIEARIELGGLPVTFIDTAGLRQSTDLVENLGVQRALERARYADLRVFLLAAGVDQMDFGVEILADDLVLKAKDDLEKHPRGASVSGKTGYGVEELLRHVEVCLAQRVSDVGFANRERHRQALWTAAENLARARGQIEAEAVDLASEDIRAAFVSLSGLIGTVDVEEVLGVIFSTFCVGK